MKNLIYLAVVFIALSCSKEENQSILPPTKCTTCIESKTQTEYTFCGTPSQVSDYIKNLIHDGQQIGQNWSCKDSK